jgi:hypothetical protein
MQVEPLGYRGVNLGSTIDKQKQAQQWAMVQMQTRREVGASM